MSHICVIGLGQHMFRQWPVACSAPSHYLNQYWRFVDWTLRNQFQWNSNQNTNHCKHWNAFENVVCKITAILPRERFDNGVLIASDQYWINVSCYQSRTKHIPIILIRNFCVMCFYYILCTRSSCYIQYQNGGLRYIICCWCEKHWQSLHLKWHDQFIGTQYYYSVWQHVANAYMIDCLMSNILYITTKQTFNS